MRNLGRFHTTSDFDREYLRKETRYPKSERYVIENDSSAFGELWSTNHKVVHVSLDPPKSTFSGDYISAPGMVATEMFTRARGLLAHTKNRVEAPQKNKGRETLPGDVSTQKWLISPQATYCFVKKTTLNNIFIYI